MTDKETGIAFNFSGTTADLERFARFIEERNTRKMAKKILREGGLC